MYLCKPSLVTGSDARYSSDPKGLYYERIQRLADLARYQVSAARTDNGVTDVTLPTDFTDGMLVHVTTHDLAWIILEESGGAGGMNTLNEISDTDPIRFAEAVLTPFKRTTFPVVSFRGATQAQGQGTLTYCKLPADW